MSREAMKLALEALEEGLDDYWRETNPLGNQAITALKQVLEQPEPEPVALPEKIYEFVPTPEPAKWHHPECEGQCFACLIEQVVQEAYGSQGLGYLQRHLTTSPKRKPLTDEEIKDALVSVDAETKRLPPGFRNFAKAIEAKLKEKNG